MKKILVVISFVMAVFSFQANAANIALGTISLSKDFSNTVSGAFSDTYTFNTSLPSTVGVSATNVAVKFSGNIFGEISNFAGTLNGVALEFSTATVGNAIAKFLVGNVSGATDYTLVLSGNAGNGASYGGSIAVAPVPVPAAVWLFGSALMGMLGVSRRKKA